MDFEHTKCIADMLNILKHHTVDGEDVTDEWFGHLFRYNAIPQEKMIGAIVKANVDSARNDGKIRRFPWQSEMWHLHLAHETPHGDSSSGLARSYHFRKASEPKGKYIMDEMRAELSIKPVDYFNFTGYPATVVR